MVKDLIFYILLPILFAGIAFLNYKIRLNKRYDFFFNIDWESISPGNSVKLLNSLTFTGIIFSLISMLYFPILKFSGINSFIIILTYVGLSLAMAFIMMGFIAKFQRGIP